MPATSVNLTIDKGTSFRRRFLVKTPTGGIFPLAGFFGRGQIRANYGVSPKLAQFGVDVDALTGIVTITLTADQTTASTLTVTGTAPHVYDVEIYSASGIVYRIVQGTVSVTPEVTTDAA